MNSYLQFLVQEEVQSSCDSSNEAGCCRVDSDPSRSQNGREQPRRRESFGKNRGEPEGQDSLDEDSFLEGNDGSDASEVIGEALDSVPVPSLSTGSSCCQPPDAGSSKCADDGRGVRPETVQLDGQELQERVELGKSPPSVPEGEAWNSESLDGRLAGSAALVHKAVSTSAITASPDASNTDLQRSMSCVNLNSDRFVHVESRVKQYIREIKRKQAEHREAVRSPGRSSTLSESDRPAGRPLNAPWFIPNDNSEEEASSGERDLETLRTEVRKTKRVTREKDRVLSELQQSHQELLLKYAAAENVIDKLRVSSLYPHGKMKLDSESEVSLDSLHGGYPALQLAVKDGGSYTSKLKEPEGKLPGDPASLKSRPSETRLVTILPSGNITIGSESEIGITASVPKRPSLEKGIDNSASTSLSRWSETQVSRESSSARSESDDRLQPFDLQREKQLVRESRGSQTCPVDGHEHRRHSSSDTNLDPLVKNASDAPTDVLLQVNRMMEAWQEGLASSFEKWQGEMEVQMKRALQRQPRSKAKRSGTRSFTPTHLTLSLSGRESQATSATLQDLDVSDGSAPSSNPRHVAENPDESSGGSALKKRNSGDKFSRHGSTRNSLEGIEPSSSIETSRKESLSSGVYNVPIHAAMHESSGTTRAEKTYRASSRHRPKICFKCANEEVHECCIQNHLKLHDAHGNVLPKCPSIKSRHHRSRKTQSSPSGAEQLSESRWASLQSRSHVGNKETQTEDLANKTEDIASKTTSDLFTNSSDEKTSDPDAQELMEALNLADSVARKLRAHSEDMLQLLHQLASPEEENNTSVEWQDA